MQVGCTPVLGGFCDSDVESNRRTLKKRKRLGLTCGGNRKEEKLWSGHCCNEVMEALRRKKRQRRLERGRWMCVTYSSILGMKYKFLNLTIMLLSTNTCQTVLPAHVFQFSRADASFDAVFKTSPLKTACLLKRLCSFCIFY